MIFSSAFCRRVILALLLSFFVFNSTTEAASTRRLIAAGRAGNTDAMREVGWILWDGTSKYRMNRAVAIRWWERAAREGDEKSMVILGELYEKGIYFDRNKEKARECYEEAEAAGSRKAAKRLARMELEEQVEEAIQGDYDDVEIGSDLFLALEKKAGEGHTTAMRVMANILWSKETDEQDNEALRWWRRAAKQGDEQSALMLGNIYVEGLRVERNIKLAKKYYTRAEKIGRGDPQERLELLEAIQQGEEEEARLAAEEKARAEEEARLAAEQEAREEEESRLAAAQKAQTNKAAEQTVAPSSAPAVAMTASDSKGPAPVDFTPRFGGSGKAPTRIDVHQITEFRGSGSDPYPFLASATEVRPDGSVGVYTGNNIPPGMKPYVNHSGRPDNGSAWGKHIAYRPMTKGEMVVENAPQLADAAVFSGALFESGVRDIENGEYASGCAKTAGAGAIIGGLLWLVGQALQGN